ncbi:polysaccharide export outer membrane protein [Natronoflexus pectinivorans]|uniref:Polysaccharide export outer membrane protein n=2 Tax=Natronoflexus pectinivorans TaxID=682526 RepID=A0A4R2GKN2_9BACT|nr:polysaccharide export outer membrane protein [Natronoflexus pectinivorans]
MSLFTSNKIKILSPVLILFMLYFNSCIPHREIIYFQDLEDTKGYDNPFGELETVTERYILQPNDALIIRVRTSNPQLYEFFNMTSSQNVAQATQWTYPIDDNYEIDFPFVGKINLKGCTRQEAKERIIEALLPFLSDAQVTVRIANPSFVALGEFTSRGRIAMGRDQVNIFEAVALAGDVRPFGKKRELTIIRPTMDGSETIVVDLTDRNLIDSDHFYIYPNDILYIRPMRARQWGIGESFSFGILTSLIAFYFTLNAILN